MKKGAIIILIFIIILIILGVIAYFGFGAKEISQMTDEEFIKFNLKQKEVIRTIGNEPIIRTQVSPLNSFSQENLDIVISLRPECAGLIKLGTPVKTMTFYTSRRQIGTIWTVEDNKLICVASTIIPVE